jgi:hypothetical protein
MVDSCALDRILVVGAHEQNKPLSNRAEKLSNPFGLRTYAQSDVKTDWSQSFGSLRHFLKKKASCPPSAHLAMKKFQPPSPSKLPAMHLINH